MGAAKPPPPGEGTTPRKPYSMQGSTKALTANSTASIESGSIMSRDRSGRHSAAGIPATYRGCRFRSRLEARWAVFFDHIGIEWQYEPQGYLIDGRPYLPDFLLECGTWVEVKGSEDALDKPLMLAAALQLPQMPASRERGPQLMILGSLPRPDTHDHDYGWLGIDPDVDEDHGVDFWPASWTFGIFAKNRRPWYEDGRDLDDPWLTPTKEYGHLPWEAYVATNGARFEHGERGF